MIFNILHRHNSARVRAEASARRRKGKCQLDRYGGFNPTLFERLLPPLEGQERVANCVLGRRVLPNCALSLGQDSLTGLSHQLWALIDPIRHGILGADDQITQIENVRTSDSMICSVSLLATWVWREWLMPFEVSKFSVNGESFTWGAIVVK